MEKLEPADKKKIMELVSFQVFGYESDSFLNSVDSLKYSFLEGASTCPTKRTLSFVFPIPYVKLTC